MEIYDMSALEIGKAIKRKEISAREAMEAVLGRIDNKEEDLHCYITVDSAEALKRADEVQKKIDAGELAGPLAGVPAAVKDNICTEGVKTTCASRILYDFKPCYSAQCYVNLESAGAVMIGKTNMDEFAMGSTTETSYFGPTKNPYDMTKVPGGSSGGSAAAVASGEAVFALGTDTGGSIRQPASYCGVVGMKPTYGTVSRYGVVAYGSSLDQVGPLTRNVSDCAAVLEAVSSHDTKDSTSLDRKDLKFTESLKEDVKGMRIGIPSEYFGDGLDDEVRKAVLCAADELRAAGAEVSEFSLKMVDYAIPAYYTIACAEASSNLERFDGVKYGYRAQEYADLHSMYKKTRSEGFGAEVRRRIMLGSFVLSSGYYDAYYLKALRVKALLKRSFDSAFEKYNCIISPVAPSTAPVIGSSLADPLKMYLGDIYTIAVNLCGLPGISLPCGRDSSGMPIGVQFIGDTFHEDNIIRTAYTYEKLRGAFGGIG